MTPGWQQSVLMAGTDKTLQGKFVGKGPELRMLPRGSLLMNNFPEDFWSRFSCLHAHDHESSDRKRPMAPLAATELEIVTHTELTLWAYMSEGYGPWKLLPEASDGCELGEHQTGWVPWTKTWSTWSLSFSHDTKGSEIPEMCGIYKAKPKAMMNCLTQETNHMNRAEGAKLSKAGRTWTMPSGALDARPGALSRKGLSFLAIIWESGYLFCAVRYQKYKTYFWVLHRLHVSF